MLIRLLILAVTVITSMASVVWAAPSVSHSIRTQCETVQRKAKLKKFEGIERAAEKAIERIEALQRKCQRISQKLDRFTKVPKKVRSPEVPKVAEENSANPTDNQAPDDCSLSLKRARKLKNPQAIKRLEAQIETMHRVAKRCEALGKRLKP